MMLSTRIPAALFASSIAVGLGLVLTGCPPNSCFLKICTGDDCRCSISSCPSGSAFDLEQDRCRCQRGYYTVGGHCLDQAQANAYCGPSYTYVVDASTLHAGDVSGGCVKNQCRQGDLLDEETGWCFPPQAAGAEQGKTLACPAGEVLVVAAGNASCVPAAMACARDESWDGSRCAKTASCPSGSAWDAARQSCVEYVSGGGSKEASIDVVAWAQATYGQNGGRGTSAFCNTFARKPWAFGIAPGSSARVRATVQVGFPGREVARGGTFSQSSFSGSAVPVPARGAYEVDQGARSLLTPLAMGGGRASVESTQTTVECDVVHASAPQTVPPTGGF